jgi:hypothetical protein
MIRKKYEVREEDERGPEGFITTEFLTHTLGVRELI